MDGKEQVFNNIFDESTGQIDDCGIDNGQGYNLDQISGVRPQRLAGHSSITTTQKYYLSVQREDMEAARNVTLPIPENDRTDPLLTHSGQNGHAIKKAAKRNRLTA